MADETRISSANIMFCLDTTSSMTFAINAIQQTLNKLAEIYLTSRIEIKVGLVEFRDRVHAAEQGNVERDPSGYPTLRMISFGDQGSFTDNVISFQTQINSLIASGGGPAPESSFDALAFAARESTWDLGSTKIIIHITDDRPRIPDYDIASVHELKDILSDAGIQQLFIVAPDKSLNYFENLSTIEYSEGVFALTGFFELSMNPSVENLVTLLERVAQTSSDSILESENDDDLYIDDDDDDGWFGDDEESPVVEKIIESDSENPFDDDDVEKDTDSSTLGSLLDEGSDSEGLFDD
jgi:hypothetical protein